MVVDQIRKIQENTFKKYGKYSNKSLRIIENQAKIHRKYRKIRQRSRI